MKLQQPIKIAPGQTRVVPLRLSQHSPFKGTQLHITLHVAKEEENTGERVTKEVSITLPLRHLPAWPHIEQRVAIRASYLVAYANPTFFSVLPPLLAGRGSDKVPILALRAYLRLINLARNFYLKICRWRRGGRGRVRARSLGECHASECRNLGHHAVRRDKLGERSFPRSLSFCK